MSESVSVHKKVRCNVCVRVHVHLRHGCSERSRKTSV